MHNEKEVLLSDIEAIDRKIAEGDKLIVPTLELIKARKLAKLQKLDKTYVPEVTEVAGDAEGIDEFISNWGCAKCGRLLKSNAGLAVHKRKCDKKD